MLRRFFISAGVIASFVGFVPVRASDLVQTGGGTLSQIVDGGGTFTIITLVNMGSSLAPYQLSFFDDNGNPLSLSTTAGTGSILTGALSANGSSIIQTNGGGALVSGYAVLSTGQLTQNAFGIVTSLGNTIAGSAVFSIPLSSGVVAQASCPLDTGFDAIFALPFNETGDATSAQTGVAIANSPSNAASQANGKGETALVQVTLLDQNGIQIPTPAGQVDTLILPFGGHTSFMLDGTYPQIIGQKGTAVFKGTNANGFLYAIKVLGLRATPTTFTSITPIVPCNPLINPNGTYGGCGN